MSENETIATAESVREFVATLAAPLREQLGEIEEAVTSKQAELQELREIRAELRKALMALDPEFPGRGRPAKKIVPRRDINAVKSEFSSEKLDEILQWLRANAEEFNGNGGFYATDISKRPDAPTGQSRINKALVIFHEQGLVRLDRKEGLTKFYKVVA